MEYELGLLSSKEDLLGIMINRTDVQGLLSLPVSVFIFVPATVLALLLTGTALYRPGWEECRSHKNISNLSYVPREEEIPGLPSQEMGSW